MNKYLMLLILLSAGCTNNVSPLLKVGDCVISHDMLLKIMVVGNQSYRCMDLHGRYYVASNKFTYELVDCYTAFDKSK